MLSRPSVVPIPDRFPEYLQDYCEQAKAGIKGNKHHDQWRALFMDFLRAAEVLPSHSSIRATARLSPAGPNSTFSNCVLQTWEGRHESTA